RFKVRRGSVTRKRFARRRPAVYPLLSHTTLRAQNPGKPFAPAGEALLERLFPADTAHNTDMHLRRRGNRARQRERERQDRSTHPHHACPHRRRSVHSAQKRASSTT